MSEMNYFCVHVTVQSHLISRFGGMTLSSYSVFEVVLCKSSAVTQVDYDNVGELFA